MPTYEYRIVPFLGDVPARDQRGAEKVATQLQALIAAHTTDGWEFHRIDQVQVLTRPGCLGALAGRGNNIIGLDMVSFRRERAAVQ